MHTLYVKGKIAGKSADLFEMMDLEYDIVDAGEATHEECEIVSDNIVFLNPVKR